MNNLNTKKGSRFYPDSSYINVLSDDDIALWTKQLQITEDQLRKAVFLAGPLVTDVKKYLEKRGL